MTPDREEYNSAVIRQEAFLLRGGGISGTPSSIIIEELKKKSYSFLWEKEGRSP